MMKQMMKFALGASPANLQVTEPLLPDRGQASARLSTDAGSPKSAGEDEQPAPSAGHGENSRPGAAQAASGTARKIASDMRFHLEMARYVTGVHGDMEHRKEAAKRIIDCFRQKTPALNLDGLGTRSLPNVFQELRHLQHFSHRQCGMKELPPSFKSLTNLETLQISRDFTALAAPRKCLAFKFPNALAFPKLKTLKLDNCDIDAVPEFIGRCPELESLSLRESAIRQLPHFLAECRHLQELDLSESAFPKDRARTLSVVSPFWDSCKLPTIKVLHMTGLHTGELLGTAERHFFDGLHNLENLEELDFSGNKMTMFPRNLGPLEKLKLVNFNGNPLFDIGPAVNLPAGCHVSLFGMRDPWFENVIKKMQEMPEDKGPVIQFTIPYREPAWTDPGSPGSDPEPGPVLEQVEKEIDGQLYKPGKLVTLRTGKSPVLEDFSVASSA